MYESVNQTSLTPDVCVLHHCDNPSCCNPEHLFIGSHADNVADKVKKGRAAAGRGERHRSNKLSEEQVLAIRVSAGSAKTLGAQYGVTKQTIGQIRRRKIWRWLDAG
jgi:hypothetical protein